MEMTVDYTYTLKMNERTARRLHLALKNLTCIIEGAVDTMPHEYNNFVNTGGVDTLLSLRTVLDATIHE